MESQKLASAEKGPWATFMLGDEVFAVSAEHVQEVMVKQPLTPVPLAPAHVIGLLNLRGQIMPAIDLRTRLLFARRGEEEQSSYMVIKSAENIFSVIVDSIGDVVDLDPSTWELPPETLAPAHRAFVFGICPLGNGVVLGLRAEALSGDGETFKSEVGL